jgi:hypothetical protein
MADDEFGDVEFIGRLVGRVQLFEGHDGKFFGIEFYHDDGSVTRLAFHHEIAEPLIEALRRSQEKTAGRRNAPRH